MLSRLSYSHDNTTTSRRRLMSSLMPTKNPPIVCDAPMRQLLAMTSIKHGNNNSCLSQETGSPSLIMILLLLQPLLLILPRLLLLLLQSERPLQQLLSLKTDCATTVARIPSATVRGIISTEHQGMTVGGEAQDNVV